MVRQMGPSGFEIDTPPALSDARLRSLYEYWHALGVKAGGMPPIQAFDPLHLPKLLPNIWILEVAPDTRRFRMRLAGENINAIYGRNVGGQYFSDVFERSEIDLIVSRYTRALTEPAIFTATGAVYAAAGRLSQGERLSLPMLGRSGVTDTMLGATIYGDRLVDPGPLQVTGGVPRFYPFRAANHRAPQIDDG
jgi:hypothetical protein